VTRPATGERVRAATGARPGRIAGPRVVVDPLRPGEEEAWDAFVADCPEASFFHRAGWKAVLQRAFEYWRKIDKEIGNRIAKGATKS